MEKKLFFSIVIPTYNRVSDLEFALFCILKQNITDYEIIISDNCSTDETQAVIAKLKNKKIRYFRNKQNIDYAFNVKEAVSHAKGEYVFLHGDDDFFLYEDTLETVKNEMLARKLGYLRINFISLALDKKHIFSYKLKKSFTKNKYLLADQTNYKVLNFITNSNPYFITGIVFRNNLLDSVSIINADPYPWINAIFYSAKNFGACFMEKPYIVATWSRRKIKRDVSNQMFETKDGKLKSDNYFKAIREKINEKEYVEFLHSELLWFYIRLLPAIKINVGNEKMLKLCKKIRQLDPIMTRTVTYWVYFIPSLIFSASFLQIIRDVFLHVYIRRSKVQDESYIMEQLKKLEKNFLSSKDNVSRRKDRFFKF